MVAVGLAVPENLAPIEGVRLATCAAGIRKQDREDLLLIELQPDSLVAAVFTQNQFCAAPVVLAKSNLVAMMPQYLLVNAGNANAGTGQPGLDDAQSCCAAIAEAASVDKRAVLPFSTGVIGQPLPVEKITAKIPYLLSHLNADNWLSAANAIMTTDTVAKAVSRSVDLSGGNVSITGIAKGSGMICPNMATMLAYIATDAKLNQSLMNGWVSELADDSFNAITVDGDTSTNDACVLMATGASGVTAESVEDKAKLRDALQEVFTTLAQAIVRDGEGATKFITIEVKGARDKAEARDTAYTIAHSPLVKTAMFGCDPNWGRILAAVGRAPVKDLSLKNVDIFLGEAALIQAGELASTYTEEQGQAVMSRSEITIQVLLGRGGAAATVWTSDLSHDYVSINADYRT